MRTGLFCTYENPNRNYASAYAEQTRLVQHIEDLGFDEAWVAEHHFNPDAASPSPLPILAYLAARTSRIRLGTAALLLPFHNPLLVAEEVATLDILSGGRLDLGIAKGGPFPAQNKHFGIAREDSQPLAKEAFSLIRKLLSEENVTFEGHHFNVHGVSITPQPIQKPVPIFLATSTPAMIRIAAENDCGIMAGPPFPVEAIQSSRELYLDAARMGDPRLVLIRFFHPAPTRAQAVEEATRLLQGFVDRMQAATNSMQPAWTPWFKLDRIIEDSLIGTIDEIREKVLRIESKLQPRSLILKPIHPDIAKRLGDLETFSQIIGADIQTSADDAGKTRPARQTQFV